MTPVADLARASRARRAASCSASRRVAGSSATSAAVERERRSPELSLASEVCLGERAPGPCRSRRAWRRCRARVGKARSSRDACSRARVERSSTTRSSISPRPAIGPWRATVSTLRRISASSVGSPASRAWSAAARAPPIAPCGVAAPEPHLTGEIAARSRGPPDRSVDSKTRIASSSGRSHRRMARLRIRCGARDKGRRRDASRRDRQLAAGVALLDRLDEQRLRAAPTRPGLSAPCRAWAGAGKRSGSSWRRSAHGAAEEIGCGRTDRRGRRRACRTQRDDDPHASASSRLRSVSGPSSARQRVRLLEVVADDLLELLAATVEPAGEALVEVGALRFRDRGRTRHRE